MDNRPWLRFQKVTGEAAIKAFGRAGFLLHHIKGSHHVLKRPGHRHHLSIPVHRGKTLGVGLLSNQIKLAGLTVEQFVELL